MHLSTPDLSVTVLMIVGTLALFVARKARQHCAALMPAAQSGDMNAVAAGRRQSTIAMAAIVVGVVAWVAAIAASLHP